MADHNTSTDAFRLLPSALESALQRAFLRVGGAVLVVVGFVGWLSLVSWSKYDPSFSTTSGSDLRNIVGNYGAILSDLMVQTIGLSAALLVAAPVVWGVHLMFDRPLSAGRMRVAAAAGAILCFALGLASIPKIEAWPLVYGFGGLIGDVLYNVAGTFLQPFMGPLSGPLIGLGALAAGVLLFGSAVGFGREDLQSAWAARKRLSRANRAPAYQPSEYEFSDGDERGEPTFEAWLEQSRENHDAAPTSADAPFSEPLHVRMPPVPRGGIPQPPPIPQSLETEDHGELPVFLAGRGAQRSAPDPDTRTSNGAVWLAALTGGASQVLDRVQGVVREGMSSLPIRTPSTSDDTRPPPPPPPPMPAQPASAPSVKSEPGYRPPALNLLATASRKRAAIETDKRVLQGQASLLEDVLSDFGVQATVQDIRPGPVITLYEIEIARGIKASRVIGLADDIARSMSAPSARIAVVPGSNTLGIELPNMTRETVALREIVASPEFRNEAHILPIGLGKSIDGQPIVADLARMPHLLVAGTTGSGKSVGVNAMILSLLYRHGPERMRMLMIDPKMLELSIYNGIPHLLTPVITDPMKAVSALNWAVREMEERYKKMSELSVRNIGTFNQRVRDAARRGRPLTTQVQTGFDDQTGEPLYETRALASEPMPHIVVIVDEFADLMVVAGKEIEASLQRLAQMARAAGIHLIMATQRPSVDVVTGTIKANFPARIAFKVASKIDSRTILNTQGAEQLLGQGDMLLSDGSGALNRVHGAFVADEEVEAIVADLRKSGAPVYFDGVTDGARAENSDPAEDAGNVSDLEDLYAKAVAIAVRDRKASTSYIQRRLSIGYNRAADLIERMETDGIISAAGSAGRREILVDAA